MKLFYSFFFITLLNISCQKNITGTSDQTSVEPGKTLIEETPEAFVEADPAKYQIDTMLLPNGEKFSEFEQSLPPNFSGQFRLSGTDPFEGLPTNQVKTALISRLLVKAEYLINRSNFTFPLEGPNKPAQNGLAYVYGSSTINVRKIPSEGSCRDILLYGLDCSGFVQQLFHYAKLNNFPTGSYNQILPNTVQKSLNLYPSLKNLKAIDKGKLDPEKFESGDLIYWNKLDGASTNHIGLILKSQSGKVLIYQSGGTTKYPGCSKNSDVKHGPKTIELSGNYYFGAQSANWKITRIVTLDNNSNEITSNNLTATNVEVQYSNTFPQTYFRKAIINTSGGSLPYNFCKDNGPYQISNSFIIDNVGTYEFKIKDAQGFVKYIKKLIQ